MTLTVVKIFLTIVLYPTAPIVYFIVRNEARPKKNIVIGVTIPYTEFGGSEVKAVTELFERRLKRLIWISSALFFAGLAIPYFSIWLTWNILWMVAVPAAAYVLFAKANLALADIKRKNGWRGAYQGKTVVDISAAMNEGKRLNPIWFIIPAVIASVPVAAAFVRGTGRDGFASELVVSAVMLVTVICCLFLYPIVFRQRSELVDGRTELSVVLTRVRQRAWGQNFVALAWLTAAFSVVFMLSGVRFNWIMISSTVYSAVILAVCLSVEFRVRRVQEKLTATEGGTEYIDEDRFWIYGIFYFNRNDNHFYKNDRTGSGGTVNLAKPVGKALIVFVALCILAIPLFGTWTIVEEFSPIVITAEDGVLTAGHAFSRYELPAEDIVDITWLDGLPKMLKISGTGMENVRKGRYRVEGKYAAIVCLDPSCEEFVRLTMEDGSVYIFSCGAEMEPSAMELLSDLDTNQK